LEVDQIIEEIELVIRPLGPMIVPPGYIYGGSILADGQLTLVIDGAALAKHVFEQQSNDSINGALVSFTPPILSSNSQPHKLPAATLLLVDDSLTLRQALALTLQNMAIRFSKHGMAMKQLNSSNCNQIFS
jgi:chemotaxis protein histidine kinase CheA